MTDLDILNPPPHQPPQNDPPPNSFLPPPPAPPSMTTTTKTSHRAENFSTTLRLATIMHHHLPRPKAIEAARHICDEARVVLSSLRGGPPPVARGELAQDLRDVRVLVKSRFLDPPSAGGGDRHEGSGGGNVAQKGGILDTPDTAKAVVGVHGTTGDGAGDNFPSTPVPAMPAPEMIRTISSGSHVLINDPTSTTEPASSESQPLLLHPPPSPMPVSKICNFTPADPATLGPGTFNKANTPNQQGAVEEDVGPYAKPFLNVVMDPRAAGPHTLVALRSLHRLLERGSLSQLTPGGASAASMGGGAGQGRKEFVHTVALEPLMRGVLACKFEQTDAGADEAVEMAIADLLSLIINLDAAGAATAATSVSGGREKGCRQQIQQQRLKPETWMEAFNTVFVTRNTFVHSPALCYHFEEVLTGMVTAAFGGLGRTGSLSSRSSPTTSRVRGESGRRSDSRTSLTGLSMAGTGGSPAAARLILEFLVSQMLHTPLVGGNGTNSEVSGAAASLEAQAAHEATRVLCLKLTRCCLRTGWGDSEHLIADKSEPEWLNDKLALPTDDNETKESAVPVENNGDSDEDDFTAGWEERTLLRIIQDDLCLSLLMTGQAIWAYHDASTNISPGIISIEVLSEICSTLSTLWNITKLRVHLLSQFENIFTGFYQRALALLRKRPVPNDSATFHSNMVFDAEVEIILESLVDLLCLHDDTTAGASGGEGGGSLETLFVTYDCATSKSDVASGLIVELCRCCGGTVGEDGEVILTDQTVPNSAAASGAATPSASPATPDGSDVGAVDGLGVPMVHWRHVPAHLKELCAEALVGCLKCLFRDGPSTTSSGSDEKQAKSGPVTDVLSQPTSSLLRSLPPPPVMSTTIAPPASTSVEESAPTQTPNGASSLRSIKSKKRLMRKAAHVFNEKPSKGIAFLASSGLIPTPVTPHGVASFLRSGIVLGLDKRAVGSYLGEAGKGPKPGKNPPAWERDWFHKEALALYCSLFRFEHQSLLDGLRMFLAAFRLPGEAQQIDRILQAFAESCGRTCDESDHGRLKLFSSDEKKASDAAYLLSFSIIMLNTDQHNDNIRADRKMSAEDFVKNNTDYGRDITDEGKALPREYLLGIYESIREEQIRTEGEGADGVMTVERWKDVLRGGSSSSVGGDGEVVNSTPAHTDAGTDEDLRELLIETVWMPILSAIGGFWGMTDAIVAANASAAANHSGTNLYGLDNTAQPQSGMLGAQGARLGMDLATELLGGVRSTLNRNDIFHPLFSSICHCTGLLGPYYTDAVDRTSSFIESVERQSAVIVAINTAKESGDEIGIEGWKCVWGMIFELRDMKLLGGGNKRRSIMIESEPDLLTDEARREWTMRLVKGDVGLDGMDGSPAGGRKARKTVLGAIGRALFGSDTSDASTRDDMARSRSEEGTAATDPRVTQSDHGGYTVVRTRHGKEELVLWDDLAPSDDEDDVTGTDDEDEDNEFGSGGIVVSLGETPHPSSYRPTETPTTVTSSAGAAFESQLIHEDHLVYHYPETPITGLERMDDTQTYQISPRARVRKRLARACDFVGLVNESRFLDQDGIQNLLGALLDIVAKAGGQLGLNSGGAVRRHSADNLAHMATNETPATTTSTADGADDEGSDGVDDSDAHGSAGLVISPASEAFAEIVICEIALKNRDRIHMMWETMLRTHYSDRLAVRTNQRSSLMRLNSDSMLLQNENATAMTPGMEKCATGLLRIACWTVHREEIANDVLGSLKLLYPPRCGWICPSNRLNLDKHVSEGLWRICRNVDGLRQVGVEGWDGLLGLVEWCALRGGGGAAPVAPGRSVSLSEDDPSLQSFRSLHLMLHAAELKDVVPFGVVTGVRALIMGGERGSLPKLSIAGLDLLQVLHTRLESLIANAAAGGGISDKSGGEHKEEGDSKEGTGRIKKSEEDVEVWVKCWLPVLEGMAEAAEKSRYSSVRQHALAMLTDAMVDRHGRAIPDDQLCGIVNKICIPLAGKRIAELLSNNHDMVGSLEEIMIELELCISLMFKPFLHHLKNLITVEGEFLAVWISVLGVMSNLLGGGNNGQQQHGTERASAQPMDDPYDRHAALDGSRGGMMTREKLLLTTQELGSEHLRNAVMVLIACGVLKGDSGSGADDFSTLTWKTIGTMHFCTNVVEEWKKSAMAQTTANDGDVCRPETTQETKGGEDPQIEEPLLPKGEDTCEVAG